MHFRDRELELNSEHKSRSTAKTAAEAKIATVAQLKIIRITANVHLAEPLNVCKLTKTLAERKAEPLAARLDGPKNERLKMITRGEKNAYRPLVRLLVSRSSRRQHTDIRECKRG